MTCATTVFDNTSEVSIGKNALAFDAWGRPKSVVDYSIFHGLFSFNVPFEMWVEEIDQVEQQISRVNFASENGELICNGTAGKINTLMSKRHPRYQPNRGYLYSSSMFIDTADSATNHDFGSATETSGLFFRVVNNLIYAVLRTTIGLVTTDRIELIPFSGDLTKGHVYDIQAQWRGVGNIAFFIDLELVFIFKNLGALENLSINNPALPIIFALNGAGKMRCGCVDVTSEGGEKDTRQRGFADTGEIALSSQEVPVLIARFNSYLTYGGQQVRNTRDIALRRVAAFADDNTILRVYYTRNGAKFTGTVWSPDDDIGAVDFSVDGDIVIDNLTTNIKRIATKRITANDSTEINNPDDDFGEFYLTAGDYVLVTAEAKNATSGGASLVWSAEI